MNKIILDLEFCKMAKNELEAREICKHEIIQIGAVKLDSQNKIIDSFNMLVKPCYSNISKKVERLTHISNEMVSDAPDFIYAMDQFFSWIGQEPFIMYSWSMTDKEVMRDEAMLKGYNDHRLLRSLIYWMDLQKMVDETIGVEKQLSLENVLRGVDIVFEGQQHSALDDARNTAYIFQIMQDKTSFSHKMRPIVDLFAPKEEVTFTLGNLFSGINLQLAAC
jgi:inhibitor of KinA sporulation pathway (predicted exonuclease)